MCEILFLICIPAFGPGKVQSALKCLTAARTTTLPPLQSQKRVRVAELHWQGNIKATSIKASMNAQMFLQQPHPLIINC